jgi:sarcosine oxidase subunit gamma
MPTPLRTNPLDAALRHPHPGRGQHRPALEPVWAELGDMPIVLHWQDPAAERVQMEELALADLSCQPRVVAKGPRAAEFLASQGWPVPEQVLNVLPSVGGGLVARTGANEFLVEGLPGDERVGQLEAALAQAGGGVYRVPRQDAIMALVGSRAVEALRHACAYDFASAEAGGPVVMTRMAGVSCTVIVRSIDNRRVFELSTEGTFGVYLWHVLLEIVYELGGGPIGVAALDPQLAGSVATGGPVAAQGNQS